MRDLILKEIAHNLQAMGFNVDLTGDADLYVNEILTAATGNGSGGIGNGSSGIGNASHRDTHKLEITLAIALDLKEKELLYFEKISEHSSALANSGMGFDYGMETEVQFGKQVSRTITRVQQNDTGEIVEMTYDLGALQGIVRSVAEKFGLRFKAVLTMGKIKRHSHQEYDGFSQGMPEVTNATYSPQTVTASDTPEFSRAKRKGLGILFILLWFMSLGFFLLILLAGTTSLMGALLMIGTHVLMLLIYMLFTRRGWLQGLILWALMVLIAFVAMMVTTDFETTTGEADAKGGANAKNDVAQTADPADLTDTADSFIFDQGHSLFVYPWPDTVYNADGTTTHRLVLTGQVFQRLVVEPPLIADVDTEVVRAVISDVALVKAPKAGTLTAIRPSSDINANLKPKVEDESIVYNLAAAYESMDSYSVDLAFEFDISPLAVYTYPKDYTGEYSTEKTLEALGLDASDYTFELQYTLTVYTADEYSYVMKATTSPLTGDFLRDGNQAIYDQRR